MRKWILTGAAVLVLALLALTAQYWFPPFLAFIDVNTDRIQGITDLVQLVFWLLAGIAVFVGLWGVQLGRLFRGGEHAGEGGTLSPPQVLIEQPQETIVVADVEQLWQIIDNQRPGPDLRHATEQYLAHLVTLYRYLDFRGMGMSDRVSLRLPLLDMYVPLKARIERPEGETWARELRLAGRQVTPKEAEAMGQRLSEPLPVLDLLKKHEGLILLGDPGAGKTTFLKYLTLRLALGQANELGLEPRLPILLPLSAYANALAERDVPLDRFIGDYFEGRGIGLPVRAMLNEALEKGGALLLLDGLDEVKHLGQRRDVVNRVVDFFSLHSQQGNKFILTSRIVGYGQVKPTVEGLTECTLVDFGDEEIELFVTKWSRAIEIAARGDTPVAAREAAREREELLAALERNPGIRRLAANPLLLTVLALMKRQGVNLPERRAELYEQYVRILIHQWNLARGLGRSPDYLPDPNQVLKVLAPLALWIHESSPGVGLVQEENMRRRLLALFREAGVADEEAATQRFIQDVRDYANLLVERGHREYGFLHLTFQEYLAGRALAQQSQQGIEPMVKALSEHIEDDSWREVSLLAVGYLGVVQQRDEAASAVLQALVERQPGEPGEAVILAGQALLDAWPGGVTETARQFVVAHLHKTMQERTIQPHLRLRSGLLLADLGVLPPDLDEFVSIPARADLTYDVGYDFQMAKYPVTNAQFRRFVDAGGYEEDRPWWTEEAIKDIEFWKGNKNWRQGPRFWDDERFNKATQPVVGVSWYEAAAYCQWLTQELRARGEIRPDQEVRLPTLAEWERAARSTHGQEYPWGSDQFDPARANTREGDLGQTTPVHMYPDGATPEGVWDLAGNAWEWSDEQSFLKGGSWYNDGNAVQASARDHWNPGNWDGYGFRLVVVPVSR